MGFDLGSLLSQFANAANNGNKANTTAPAGDVSDHFDQAAQNAPADLLSQGLAAMLRSDQTPPFAQAAAQMFGQANPDQQAGMLNHLLSGIGPSVLASLMSGAAGGGLASLLGQATAQGGGQPTVTPAQAATVTPDQVAQLAGHAEQQNPDIVEHMSAFYAEHASLIKTLGGAALTVALAKMAATHRG
ncbi:MULTISPECIES: hypothetical protein [unclassified Achromobacter]|uniref:hypothetical protein n=1 Tax=unclassified Achromobacter TaxID=2626865 RepID=UPI001E3CC654|nr:MULTISPECIES: hypothetical protein [unclassified Achromobacter]